MNLQELHQRLSQLLEQGVSPVTPVVTLRDGFYGGPENVWHDADVDVQKMRKEPGTGYMRTDSDDKYCDQVVVID